MEGKPGGGVRSARYPDQDHLDTGLGFSRTVAQRHALRRSSARFPRARASPSRHLASSVATCSTTSDDGAHQHDGHSCARDRCQTARHPALLDGPRVRKRRPSASVPVGLPQDHPPDWPAVGVGDLQFTGSREGSARSRSKDDDVRGLPGRRHPTRHAAGAAPGRAHASCAWSVTSLKPRDNTLQSRL